MNIVFLNIDTFLWILLIPHPGHTSLFLETVTVKFTGMRVGGAQGCRPIMGVRVEGREKQIPQKLTLFNNACHLNSRSKPNTIK